MFFVEKLRHTLANVNAYMIKMQLKIKNPIRHALLIK